MNVKKGAKQLLNDKLVKGILKEEEVRSKEHIKIKHTNILALNQGLNENAIIFNLFI